MILTTYKLLVLLFVPSFDTLSQSPRCSRAWYMQSSVNDETDHKIYFAIPVQRSTN